jgi:hypothetical protein
MTLVARLDTLLFGAALLGVIAAMAGRFEQSGISKPEVLGVLVALILFASRWWRTSPEPKI